MSYAYPAPGAINFTVRSTPEAGVAPDYQIPSGELLVGASISAVVPWHRPPPFEVNFFYQAIAEVFGNGAVTLDFFVVGTSTGNVEPIEGVSAFTLGFDPSGAAGHGVSGGAAAEVSFTPAAVGVHERYEVKGEVRKSGILVNRRVRVYSRSSGALLAQGDTVLGKFRLHCGFSSEEVTILPVDMASNADDFSPPCSNRVTTLLAQDS